MWNKEQIKSALTSRKAVLAAVSVASFASGAAGSYFFASKKLSAKYRLIADEEILSAKLFYSKQRKEGDYADPVVLVEMAGLVDEDDLVEEEIEPSQANLLAGAIEILDNQQYTNYSNAKHIPEPPSPREVEEVKQSVRNNIFDQARAEYVQDDEQAKMEAGEPYIVTVSDYMSGKSGFAQITLSYYTEDDVLANEIDIPVDDERGTVGEDNLRFGCASSDPNIVYVRNDNKGEEYEIIRVEGSFEKEVAGFTEPRGIRTFRGQDD